MIFRGINDQPLNLLPIQAHTLYTTQKCRSKNHSKHNYLAQVPFFSGQSDECQNRLESIGPEAVQLINKLF